MICLHGSFADCYVIVVDLQLYEGDSKRNGVQESRGDDGWVHNRRDWFGRHGKDVRQEAQRCRMEVKTLQLKLSCR